MLLNENGIRLPQNTKSCKILTHEDTDGFFSGLLLFNQLVKQGIDPNRINVKFVQYGNYDLLDKAAKKNRFQAVVSSDFSAFPRVDMEQCFNGFARELDRENNKYNYPKKGADWETFKSKLMWSGEPSYKRLTEWLKSVAPNAVLFTRSNDSTVRRYYEDFMKAWKQVQVDKKKGKNNSDYNNVIMTDLDYTSDHHSNEKGDLVPGKSGKIGAENYPSDTEHIAAVSAQNLMNWDDVEIISRIDSAGYKNLYDVIRMPKKLSGEGYKERLGILTSALVGSIIKSNPRLAEHLVKVSKPSLVSVYNNALKIAKLNDNEIEILNLLKQKDIDWNRINELLETLPASEQKKILSDRKDNKIKPVSSIEQMREKGEKSIAKETKLDTSDFKFYGNVSTWQASNTKLQPSRYLFAFLNKEGKNPAFNIRKFPGMGMLQVAASPFLNEKDKEKIDLEEVCKDALNEAKRKKIISDVAYNAIMKKSGGHKTIYNISGMDIVANTALQPNERIEHKYLDNFNDRRKALVNKEVKNAFKAKTSRLKELEGIKSEAKQKLISFLEDYIIKELRSKYGNIEAKPTHQFEIK